MKQRRILPIKSCRVMTLILAVGFMTAVTAHAQSLSLLLTFDTEDAGDNPPLINPGSPEFSGIIAQGRDGNMYSTTPGGGSAAAGTIYQISPAGVLGWIYSFTGTGTDGNGAVGGLTLGTDGNFYGTTVSGGPSNLGTIFKVTPSGTLITPPLHSFNGSDGAFPTAPPIQGRDGNFYGVTTQGGTFIGVVYKITPAGVFTLLSTVPALPRAPLVLATDGNFYGTAAGGATHGAGMVFRMTTAGTVTSIYDFDETHGGEPVGPVIQGMDGYLYGTTRRGGDANGDGVVFRLTTAGKKIKILHTFNGTDGSQPLGGLVQASDGNFYGVTSGFGTSGFGTLYSVTSAGVFTPLFNFDNTNYGTNPELTLLQHTNGLLYGDTFSGGTTIEEHGGPSGGQGTFYSYNTPKGLAPFVSLVSTAGKVGTSIEILGQKFTGATNVSFNGVSATFTVVSDTYLTAKVPSGATKGTVMVVDGSGTLLTSSKIFVVVPNIASFSPTSGKVGTSVVIMGSGFTQASKVTFGGVKATTFTVNSDSQITVTVPTGAKTGKIAVTTPGGTATSSGTFTVTP
jgi:uncharacterized repeat protein (TIGR03803 family)